MENWPVRDELKVELDKIKFKFEARPLPVYVGDHFIKPEDVHAMLKGALVEVHFELKHFCIKKKKEDSFNAFVQQVIILQPGKARPVNAFKRRNIFQGLIRPAPNSGAPAPALSTGASTQSEDCVNQRNDKVRFAFTNNVLQVTPFTQADDNGVDTSVSKALAGPSGKKNLSKEGDIDASPSGKVILSFDLNLLTQVQVPVNRVIRLITLTCLLRWALDCQRLVQREQSCLIRLMGNRMSVTMTCIP